MFFCRLYYSDFYAMADNNRHLESKGYEPIAVRLPNNPKQRGLFLVISKPIIAQTRNGSDYFVQVMADNGKLLWITWDTAFANECLFALNYSV